MDTEGEECVRYVKVTREGDPNDFFDGPSPEEPAAFPEPKKRWANSYARRLLYDDVRKGVVLQFDENGTPLMPVEDIYSMHPEYHSDIYASVCYVPQTSKKHAKKRRANLFGR
eukprot:scaffold6358_cov80-Cylindrotheca_fusiformis.AAC.2